MSKLLRPVSEIADVNAMKLATDSDVVVISNSSEVYLNQFITDPVEHYYL
jgi:hypothetical protein